MSATAVPRVSWGPRSRRRKTVDLDPESGDLVEGSRERRQQPLARREQLASLVVGGSFLAVAIPLALLSDSSRHPSAATVLVMLGSYALASRVEFEVGAGVGIATELLLVPMLFLLPTAVVPLAVTAGSRSGSLRCTMAGATTSSVWRFSPGTPGTLSDLRLCSWPPASRRRTGQIGRSTSPRSARRSSSIIGPQPWGMDRTRVEPRLQLRYMGWVWAVDLGALAPIGLVVAFVSVEAPAVVLMVLPLLGLLSLFARQRRIGIDRALQARSRLPRHCLSAR